MRVGIGYDSHRFDTPGPLILGGVKIPFDKHLHGHSDGDAVCHAVTDAILGAAGAGDIGEMFSDRDPANAGRDSVEMLAAAVKRVRSKGYAVAQVDVTVIAEVPKIGPHRAAMSERLAAAIGIKADAVSVKGKTNEGMGWIGRGEGIACIAIATVTGAQQAIALVDPIKIIVGPPKQIPDRRKLFGSHGAIVDIQKACNNRASANRGFATNIVSWDSIKDIAREITSQPRRWAAHEVAEGQPVRRNRNGSSSVPSTVAAISR